MKTIAERLRAARLQAGLNEKHVADFLGVSQSVISAWENGTRSINVGRLYQLSSLFGCPEEYFSPTEEYAYRLIPIAFRGRPEMSKEDLVAIAELKRLVLNLREIDEMLGRSPIEPG